jgi:PTS system nitrogen regulatory IIA component
MNLIGQFLSPRDVLLDLDVPNKNRLLEEVANFIARGHGLVQAKVLENLVTRERLGSTALGQGVAVPHARMKELRQPVAAFAQTRVAIPFDAPDGKRVSQFVTLLVPAQATDRHLLLLANVAELFSDLAFRDQLGKCTEPSAVSRLFATWPESSAAAGGTGSGAA